MCTFHTCTFLPARQSYWNVISHATLTILVNEIFVSSLCVHVCTAVQVGSPYRHCNKGKFVWGYQNSAYATVKRVAILCMSLQLHVYMVGHS